MNEELGKVGLTNLKIREEIIKVPTYIVRVCVLPVFREPARLAVE